MKKNMILHKSILIVHLIELCGKISDIYAEPWGVANLKINGDDMEILNPHQQSKWVIDYPMRNILWQLIPFRP